MSENPVPWRKIHTLPDSAALRGYLAELGMEMPVDDRLLPAQRSPLGRPMTAGALTIGNRFAIQPMEGWDATPDGRPTPDLLRRWRRFGESGAKLIWGGEAFAVCHEGRANPNQLCFNAHSLEGLTLLRQTLVRAHEARYGGEGLVVGLQLTHSGRFCRPNEKTRAEPRIAYHHPILDRRMGLPGDFPILTDAEIESIIGAYVAAAKAAWEAGFDFVDVKHCHGYLGHELLSAVDRPGRYGGAFENRTRFLAEIVQGVRREAPGLALAVRLSAFDFLPYRPDPQTSRPGRPGLGVPEDVPGSPRPYRYAFGADPFHPEDRYDLTGPCRLLGLLQGMGIRLVNITAGSPYYNPHIQRPAWYPPSDGYQPPEDPLVGVARQAAVVAQLKARLPDLVFVGSAYTYLQEFLPLAAQAAVGQGRTDLVGIGRMALAYPTLPADVLSGSGQMTRPKQLCRTFSDCTTAPRNGLPSGCYPLDEHYKAKPERKTLIQLKRAAGREEE